MKALAPERVGPYVRALLAALDALAPDRWHVSAAAARAHLGVLDPAVSAEGFLPGAHVASTGMPDPAWLERALGEQRVARRGRGDAARAALHEQLRAAELLEPVALRVVGRRLDPPEVEVLFDRVTPDGRWERVRAEVLPDRRSDAFAVERTGRVEVDGSVRHLLSRLVDAPLAAWHDTLADVARGEVRRVGRACVGPFWFPGVPLPDGVPEALGQGLVLHAAREVLLRGEGATARLDPLEPTADHGRLPAGTRVLRARRFAVTPDRVGALRHWLDAAGARAPWTVIRPPG